MDIKKCAIQDIRRILAKIGTSGLVGGIKFVISNTKNMKNKTTKIDVDNIASNHYGEITKIWREYHSKLTGQNDIGYDKHGNLFGFIAEKQPSYQSEILHIMFEEGYKEALKDMRII